MTDSNTPEDADGMPERDRDQRVADIKRWVEYITAEPPETWGPQQNAVVNGQLDAAQTARTSAAHQRHVRDVAADIIDLSDTDDE